MMKRFLLIAAVLVIAFSASAALAAEKIAVDKTHFPDDAFRGYVKQFDLNADGYLSGAEREKVKKISMSYGEDLTGVEHFTALEELRCEGAGLKELDISKNTRLKTLNVRGNELTKLDLKNNRALTEIRCDHNRLTALDLSACPGLKSLNCGQNALKKLDLSGCKALTDLACGNNQMTALDVSGCGDLQELECVGCGLKSLKLPSGKKLRSVICMGNALTTLDVSGCGGLKELSCDDNKLSALDLKANKALQFLTCSRDPLTALDVTNNTALSELTCPGCGLKALDLTNNGALTRLNCSDNALTNLNVNKCPKLTWLDARNNRLVRIRLTENKKLTDANVMLGGNGRRLTAEAGRIFLKDLGLAASAMTDVKGADKNSTFLTVQKSGKVTYDYKVRGGLKVTFTLDVTYKKGELSSVTGAEDKYPYTGKAVKPAVTVKSKIAGRTVKLTKNVHYKVYYKNNVIPGTATITVKGMGHFTGTLTKTFKITKVKLGALTLSKTVMKYTGHEVKPGVKVTAKVNGQTVTLEKGVDYSVKYTNNIKKGTATVTVTGIGNFTGTLTKKFTIK
ncbi:MAG: hypothetical protein IJR97_12260 [Clostridia bacterium]|nr:hypothetical protein [Clostridia bacterium]